jgi:hypothetical protein
VRRLTRLFAKLQARRDIPRLPPPQVTISTVVRDRMNRVVRRRLSDRVMDVFHEACIAGDLATAGELLVVMEAMHQRRQDAMGDRRLSMQDIDGAREELASRKTARPAVAPVLEPAE